jgi:hypothetical protein
VIIIDLLLAILGTKADVKRLNYIHWKVKKGQKRRIDIINEHKMGSFGSETDKIKPTNNKIIFQEFRGLKVLIIFDKLYDNRHSREKLKNISVRKP